MRDRLVLIALTLWLIVFAAPSPAAAQGQAPARDPLWNGLVIGGGIGAVAGFWIAPYWSCGGNDTECATIVRVAIGLPVFAGGLILGGVLDKLHVQSPVTWRSKSGRRELRLGPALGRRRAGALLIVSFR